MHPLEDPSTKLHEASTALLELAQVNTKGLSRKELAKLAIELQTVRNLTDALVGEVVAEATEAGVQLDHNLKRVSDFVALHTQAKPARIARDLRAGEWVRNFPIFHTAALAGELTRDHLFRLKACANNRTYTKLFDSQHYLAAAARDCSWDDFLTVLDY